MTGGDQTRLRGPFFDGLEEAARIADLWTLKAAIKVFETDPGSDIQSAWVTSTETAREIAAAIRARMTSPRKFPKDDGGEDD